jgi:hypothetical protein
MLSISGWKSQYSIVSKREQRFVKYDISMIADAVIDKPLWAHLGKLYKKHNKAYIFN